MFGAETSRETKLLVGLLAEKQRLGALPPPTGLEGGPQGLVIQIKMNNKTNKLNKQTN